MGNKVVSRKKENALCGQEERKVMLLGEDVKVGRKQKSISFVIVPKLDDTLRAANLSYSAEEVEAMAFRAKEVGRIEDKLIVWKENNLLVWGYAQFDIAHEHNLSYEIEYKSFTTMQDALAEIAEKKLLIPSITLFSKIETAKPFGEYWQGKYDREHPVCISALQKFNVLDELGIIAVKAGTSRTTVNKVNRILESKDEELIEKCRKGEISITAAYDSILKLQEGSSKPVKSQNEIDEEKVLVAEKERFEKRKHREMNILAKYSIEGFASGDKLNKAGRKFFMLRWNEEHPDNPIQEEELEGAVKKFGKEE